MREEVGRSIGLSARKVQVCPSLLHASIGIELFFLDLVPSMYCGVSGIKF